MGAAPRGNQYSHGEHMSLGARSGFTVACLEQERRANQRKRLSRDRAQRTAGVHGMLRRTSDCEPGLAYDGAQELQTIFGCRSDGANIVEKLREYAGMPRYSEAFAYL